MANDGPDNPGIEVPPPLIYLVPLVFGILLNRRRNLPFLPRGAAKALGWALIGGGVALNGWFLQTIRKADVPIRTDRPVPKLTTEGPLRYRSTPESAFFLTRWALSCCCRRWYWWSLAR